ncbi:cupin domain-containing protein [Paenarthrobacter sp. NPDC058040]|uniref:cupin domain-containing protein n=1 Tax=unclassified Paenarthrobacter TaxID=2634190 RepID=UPI0036DD3DCB
MIELSVSTEDLTPPEDYPLENVLYGTPAGKVQWLRQSTQGEGQLYVGIFTCDPCGVEDELLGDESVYMLEGRMTVEVIGGESVSLSAGDVASFPKGTKTVVHVHEPIKKFFVISG